MTPLFYWLLQIRKELLTKKLPYDNIRIDPVIMFAIIQGQLPSPEDFQLFSGDMYAQKRLYELCKQCWISDPGKRVTSKDILEYMSPTDFRYGFLVCYGRFK